MTDTTDAERTRYIENEEIAAVIDHYDDPEHPDALDVPEARELLARVQDAIESRWDDLLTDVRRGDLKMVRDTGAVVVLQDPSRGEWDRLLDAVDRYDRVDRTLLRVTHHQAARRLLEREFDGVDPVLARKPPEGTPVSGWRKRSCSIYAARASPPTGRGPTTASRSAVIRSGSGPTGAGSRTAYGWPTPSTPRGTASGGDGRRRPGGGTTARPREENLN